MRMTPKLTLADAQLIMQACIKKAEEINVDMDIAITSSLQILVLIALAMTGANFGRGLWFYLALVIAAALFLYQQYLIRDRERDACFKAFLNNNYVGAIIFIGIVVDYQVRSP